MTKVIDYSGLTYYTGKIKGIQQNLQGQINDLKARGRFLSTWNCKTGLPNTEPPGGVPYTYATGDYMIVAQANTTGTNYRPNGTSYTGTPSTTVETSPVAPNDTYIFDGTNWILWINTQKTVAFSNIAGDPYDNTNLASVLNSKQDALPSKVGHAEQALYVNASENGYEYRSPITIIKYE